MRSPWVINSLVKIRIYFSLNAILYDHDRNLRFFFLTGETFHSYYIAL